MNMNVLYILTEEPSIKNILEEVLPKILPKNVSFRILVHQGKNDLEKALTEKITSLSRIEGAKILITIDQDTQDCKLLKQKLTSLIGNNCSCDYKIRIVCRELESWLLGDLSAIEKAFPRFKSASFSQKAQMIDVDKIKGKPTDFLLRIIPEFKDRKKLPKLEFSKKIAPFLNIDNNTSVSFNHTINAIKQLCKNQS
jgi:hypothetical protein